MEEANAQRWRMRKADEDGDNNEFVEIKQMRMRLQYQNEKMWSAHDFVRVVFFSNNHKPPAPFSSWISTVFLVNLYIIKVIYSSFMHLAYGLSVIHITVLFISILSDKMSKIDSDQRT